MSLQSDWDDPGIDPGDGNRKAVPNTTISSSMINWILYSIANVDLQNHEGRITNLENAGFKKITIDTEANKPASGSTDELYIATDTNKFYRGTGTGWQEVCITWAGVVSQLEAVGSKNKAYDSDVDGVLDQAAIPSLARSKISDFFASPFWGSIPDKPSTFPPSSHTHAASEIVSGRLGLSRMPTSSTANTILIVRTADADPQWTVLNADDIPSLPASKITSGRFPLARMPTSSTANRFLAVRSVNGDPVYDALTADDIPALTRSKISDFFASPFWGSIPDKPSTYPPSSHTHPVSDLTDHNKSVHDALGIDADTVDGKHATDLETKNLQDVTASRSLDTVYQNTTGSYLLVIVPVYVYNNGGVIANSYGQISADNSTYSTMSRVSVDLPSSSYNADAAPHVLVVPPNYYYKVTSDGYYTKTAWWEVEI